MLSCGNSRRRGLRVLHRLSIAYVCLAALLALVVGAACETGERRPLTVFAAASLADVLEPLGEQFEAEKNVDLRINFGGSTSLSQVIRRGAPADVFISAGEGPMDHLESARLLVNGSRVDLAGNSLVLVVPADSSADISGPLDLLREDVSRFSTADPQLAPAGVYARQAFESMGLWDDLRPKRLLGSSVRNALMYATFGTADAAVVYASDAQAEDGVSIVWRFPVDSHAPVRYPAAAIEGADNPGDAASFIAFLTSETAQVAFRMHGFTEP